MKSKKLKKWSKLNSALNSNLVLYPYIIVNFPFLNGFEKLK